MKPIFRYLLVLSTLLVAYYSVNSQTFIRSELPTPVERPWEITYGPDDYLWLTEYGGKVSRVDPATGNKTVVYVAPDFFPGDSTENSVYCPYLRIGSGTLGLTLDPDFSNSANSYIYFLHSYNSGTAQQPNTKFRVKRLYWDAATSTVLNDTNIINITSNGFDHWGGRLLAVKQNNVSYLYLAIGDHGRSEQNSPFCYVPQSNNPNNFTQDVNTENGKIHRFLTNGAVPADNPIPGNSFFTRGHRNPQGLMYNPVLDQVYSIEHGDRTDDEINVLHSGMNYGWKDVRGYHGDGSFPSEAAYVANYVPNPQIPNDSLVEPLWSWCTTPDTSDVWTDWCTVAPSDGMYYGSNGIPGWNNSLLVVTLKDGISTDREVYQFKLLANGELAPSTVQSPNPRKFFGDDQALNGRLRDIAVSSDGRTVYLVNNGAAERITVYTYDTTNVAILDPIEAFGVQLFPNPVTDKLYLEHVDAIPDLKGIRISSILGESRVVELQSDQSIDVSNLENGVYFVNFLVGDKMYTLKFVKT